ncbi:hypothetical protein [Georgenia sp. SYP-B2076]|uniref:LppM family (lipo)protein n=1 Tax=Georgenia sp. SYP-B2076 TaxID=2495881 RepID=UPI000F8E5FDC|nr:hypothetical protein [Georgenia sp. SYP-B2076]
MSTGRPRTAGQLHALLLLPLLLLLAGCMRLDMGITIHGDDTADLALTVVDKTGAMTRDELDCSQLTDALGQAGLPGGVDHTVDAIDEGGNLGCAVTFTGAPLTEMNAQGLSISKADGVCTFTLDGQAGLTPADVEDIPGLEVALAVTFPGAVIDAGGGQVTGHTVTWTDPAVIAAGVTATGEADGGAATLLGPTSSMSWLWWVVAGLVLLAVIGAVVFVTRRNRSATTAMPAGAIYGQGSAYDGPGATWPGGAPGSYDPAGSSAARYSADPFPPPASADPYGPPPASADPYRHPRPGEEEQHSPR